MWGHYADSLPMMVEDGDAGFIKYHMAHSNFQDPPWGDDCRPVFHHLKLPDLGDPHDHLWSFWTFVMRGSYTEQVFVQLDDGTWHSRMVTHDTHSVHRVEAAHIHRIVAPKNNCLTCVLYGPQEQDFRFYPIKEMIT